MHSFENQIWRSRLAISTKLKLYNTCILPIFLYGSDCGAISKTDARKIDALNLRMLLGIKWYQFVRNDDVRRLTKQPKLTAIIQSCRLAYPIWAYYAHGRQRRCQEDPVSLPSGGLEKTTRSSPHHVAQHCPTGSETTPPYAPWSSRFGSEPPSMEDDVDVWRYAIVRVACQERRWRHYCAKKIWASRHWGGGKTPCPSPLCLCPCASYTQTFG